MKDLNTILDEVESQWRSELHKDYPLREKTPVSKEGDSMGRDWIFYTDLSKIFAIISDEESVKEKYTKIPERLWDVPVEDLIRETLHYALFHELYHPIEAPFSVSGPENDSTMINQAIDRGVKKAEPEIDAKTRLSKVKSSQNAIKDFLLDTRFSLDNEVKKYTREDIIPLFHHIELQDEPSEANLYTITRVLYGYLFGSEEIGESFSSKAGEEGKDVAKKALNNILGENKELEEEGLVDKLGEIFDRNQPDLSNRYNAIERFVEVLSPYIDPNEQDPNPDLNDSQGSSEQDIVKDILADMDESEKEKFTEELNEEGKGHSFGFGEADSEEEKEGKNTDIKRADLYAIHEFYKSNHPHIKLVSDGKEAQEKVVGTQEELKLKRSSIISEDDLRYLNLNRIGQLQRKTRMPWLVNLGNGRYRLNEYEVIQTENKGVDYVEKSLDVPDMVEFYLDSSGSMYCGGKGLGFNDGSGWDMLSHVLYGFADSMDQATRMVKKPSQMRVHNLADTQVDSDPVSISDFLEGDPYALQTVFNPENGFGQEDLNIQDYDDGKRRTYVVVTDGNLVIEGRASREAQKMRDLSMKDENDVILFEIGGTYNLGEAVKDEPNITYKQVHDKDEMLNTGLEVLLKK